MSINISNLDKSEYVEIMKKLPINDLREIVTTNNGLAKKYVVGFRPNSAPTHVLVNVYYSEISNNNTIVEKKLTSIINTYFKRKGVYEMMEESETLTDIKECISFSSRFAEIDCGIPFSLICKLLSSDLDNEKIELIQTTIEAFGYYMVSSKQKYATLIENEQNKDKQIERLKKEKDSALSKKEKVEADAKEDKKKFEKKIEEVNSEYNSLRLILEEKDEQIQRLKFSNDELLLNETKMNKEIASLEESVDFYKTNKVNLQEKIELLDKELEETKVKLHDLQTEQQIEYDETIIRLVEDTISDLGTRYTLELEQIEEVLDGIEGEHNIMNVWRTISNKNATMLEDVENAMENDIVDMNILDLCDHIENNLLVKYVILKSIKSLLFEYMSVKERRTDISDFFSK